MYQKIFYVFFILISFIFISCPSNIPEWMIENGQEIKNYPNWTTSCNAFSDMDGLAKRRWKKTS